MKKIVTFLFFLYAITGFSQKLFDNAQSIEFRPKVGFLIPHHESMAHLIRSHFFSGELSYVIHTRGKHYWQKNYKYPSLGASFIFIYTGNKPVIGNAYGITTFIKLPFINRPKFLFNIKLGAGLGYLTRCYNTLEDPKDVAIGSHVNLLINFAFDFAYKMKKGAYLGFSIDFTHLSNGSTNLPNLGLNIPSLAIFYGLKVKTAPVLDPEFVAVNRNWSMQLTGNFSVHQMLPLGGKLHPVYGFTAYMNKRFNEKTGMFLGLDFLYNESLNHTITNAKSVDWRVLQTGLFVAYDLNINHLKIYLGMGVYLKNNLNPNGPFYHKIGVRYEFSNHFYANLAVKTHWAKADYIEFGVGYKLFVKK